MKVRKVLALVLLAVLVPFADAPAAHAACSPSRSLEENIMSAPIVFVGKIAVTSDDHTEAVVNVKSIWKGPDLPQLVDVRGGFEGDRDVRTFNNGAVYLFFRSNRSEPFIDSACSATQLYSGPELVVPAYLTDAVGAETARLPIGLDGPGLPATSALTPMAIGILILVVVVGLFALYGRVMRAGPPRGEQEEKPKPVFRPVKTRRAEGRVGKYTATASRGAR